MLVLAHFPNNKDRLAQIAETWEAHRYTVSPQFAAWIEGKIVNEVNQCLLLAVSSRRLTVNMQAAAYDSVMKSRLGFREQRMVLIQS